MSVWTVLGGGAIGGFVAASLMRSGMSVSLCLSERYRNKPYHPLKFESAEGVHDEFSPDWVFAPVAQTKVLLVCLKSYHVVAALEKHQRHIDPKCVIVLLHNGMGVSESVQQRFPHNPIVLGTTANAVVSVGDLSVKQMGYGDTWLGTLEAHDGLTNATLARWFQAIPRSYWTQNIAEKVWLKLAVNSAINPITALHQCRNGALMEEAHRPLFEQVVQEIYAVCTAERLPWSQQELRRKIVEVVELTAQNYSSMNRDVFYGRKTEIESILGHLINRAHLSGIMLPNCRRLYDGIKQMESHYLTQSDTDQYCATLVTF
ncbi:2-dehydropantoate 2-reductase [Vibrio sp. Isolate23]|uniref:ketopantoate reductase family protein n=1 Tax=Vibrio sp. Isolate23 TaxID=2908533 RepID=UPI001EFEA0A4|nr:2-dehydropantoate 2-reductase [Vibrio sp. Isolate23]MCG9681831.1 2-dehydropantoate 2-reductase [Vibrio sp. Isolate23]